jgi:hypothetical protein
MDSLAQTPVAVSKEVLAQRLEAERERLFQALSIVKLAREKIASEIAKSDLDDVIDTDASITWSMVAAEKVLNSIAASLETVGDSNHSNAPRF